MFCRHQLWTSPPAYSPIWKKRSLKKPGRVFSICLSENCNRPSPLVTQTAIPANLSSELKMALNANPLLSEKVQEVQPDGSLVFDSKKVLWQDL
jgi:hypothetical protein